LLLACFFCSLFAGFGAGRKSSTDFFLHSFFWEGFLWKRNRFVCPLCAVAILTLVSGEGEGKVEGKGAVNERGGEGL
jgi:hypothetical protein